MFSCTLAWKMVGMAHMCMEKVPKHDHWMKGIKIKWVAEQDCMQEPVLTTAWHMLLEPFSTYRCNQCHSHPPADFRGIFKNKVLFPPDVFLLCHLPSNYRSCCLFSCDKNDTLVSSPAPLKWTAPPLARIATIRAWIQTSEFGFCYWGHAAAAANSRKPGGLEVICVNTDCHFWTIKRQWVFFKKPKEGYMIGMHQEKKKEKHLRRLLKLPNVDQEWSNALWKVQV